MTKTKGKIKSLKAKYINNKSTDNPITRYRESLKDQNVYSNYILPAGAQRGMRAINTSKHCNI